MTPAAVRPAPLLPGDLVAIVSPAGIVDRPQIEAAAARLRDRGFRVTVGPHALDRLSTPEGNVAGTDADRLADLAAALTAPDVKAILCSRGGYGAVRLLDGLGRLQFGPKWLIGFSDICALHALMSSRGIMSLHCGMTRMLSRCEPDNHDVAAMFDILAGRPAGYSFAPHPLNRHGRVTAPLIGGNLAVLQALIATPCDLLTRRRAILFLEDINEPVYKVERMILQLKMAGRLADTAAVMLGRFSDSATKTSLDVAGPLMPHLRPLGIPLACGLPIGHLGPNRPLLIGAEATLDITPTATTLRF